MARKTEKVNAGTGDLFRDLGYLDAGERKLRVQLAMRVNKLITEGRLTKVKAAALFGIPQPHISELKRYKLNRFSSERLMHFMTLLDRDVEILIRPRDKARATGAVSVLFAA
jgi:predicted XRE-type DNA-binding protein